MQSRFFRHLVDNRIYDLVLSGITRGPFTVDIVYNRRTLIYLSYKKQLVIIWL